MKDPFDPVPEIELAQRLASALEPYRPVLTHWSWQVLSKEITASLGFLAQSTLSIKLDLAKEKMVLDVWVGVAPCTVEALLRLLSVNFNADWKTRVGEHDATQAVVCLEALVPLEYGMEHVFTLVQEGLAAGLRRRGALDILWRDESVGEGISA